MNFSQAPERVLREFEFRNLILGLALVLSSTVVFHEARVVLSVLLGVAVSLVLFQFLKRDGYEIAEKAAAGIPYGKILRSFLVKYYLRLLALGLFMGVLFALRLIHPVPLAAGLSLTVIQGFWILLELGAKKLRISEA